MKRALPATFLALTLVALALLPGTAFGSWREIGAELSVAPGQRVRLDFKVVELEVRGHSGRTLSVELEARCRWNSGDCDEALEEIRIESHATDRKITVEIVGLPRWFKGNIEIEGTIRVPRDAPLEIDVGVGQIRIEDLVSDLRVELGVGEVEVRVEKATVDRITLDAGIGEAHLFGDDETHRGRRSMLVGSEVYWDEGGGEARIDVEVGVGEIVVRLD